MAGEFILTLGQLGLVALLGGLGAAVFRRDFNLRWFLAALALYAIYNFLLTRGFFALPNFPEEAAWNWLGKIMALAGMLAVAAVPAFGFQRSGLTLRHKEGSRTAVLVFIALAALVFYFAITGGDGRDDWETIAFQWTLPGLDEEIFYRGVLLLAMNEAFRRRLVILGAPIGYGGLLTSVIFGLAHGLDYGASGPSFDVMTFLVTGIPSLILLWLRERTGSLALPILAHNIANGAFTLF